MNSSVNARFCAAAPFQTCIDVDAAAGLLYRQGALSAAERESIEKRYLTRLRDVIGGRRHVVITSHNNPDPDAIVSALLLQRLLKRHFGVSSTLAYNGVIGRAENNALLEYASVDLKRLTDIDMGAVSAALVDTQPGTGNNAFAAADGVCMVFDHHRLLPATRGVEFYDVRTHLGATTTLLYLYWKAAGIAVSKRYATLMLYALTSETANMGRESSVVDREVYKELYAMADLHSLSKIINAKVGRAYFTSVHTGIERSKIYGSVLVTQLGKLAYPDVVAEIAEYFLRFEETKYTFAIGQYRRSLLLSLRADNPEAHLGRIAREIVAGHGSAGGHGSAAGGQIDIGGMKAEEVTRVLHRVTRRLLKALGEGGKRGRPLVPTS